MAATTTGFGTTVLNFFRNWRQNLTTFEVVATGLLDAQAIVLNLVAPVPQVARVVTVAFGVLATVSLLVKNLLQNNAAAKLGK
jgi:hypothetical protein